jgi:tetratricopeptide (TPR) repeat protein
MYRKALISLISLLVASAVACGPSHSYVEGQNAAAAGDWRGAVVAYRQAAAEDPDDDDVAGRLAHAEDQYRAQVTAEVTSALQHNDFAVAIQWVATASDLMATDSTIAGLYTDVRTAGVAYYDDIAALGEHRRAYDGALLLQEEYSQHVEVERLVLETRRNFATAQIERAEALENDGHTGAALLHWVVAQALEPSGTIQSRIVGLRTAIEEEITFRYHIHAEGLLDGAEAPILADSLAVVSESQASHLSIDADLSQPVFEESYTTSIASQRYFAGYEEVPNAGYDSALHTVERRERDVLEDEQAVVDAEGRAHSAEVDRDAHEGEPDYPTYYDRWDQEVQELQTARQHLQQMREELQDAREQLRSTPPTITREIWADFPYDVYTYTLQASSQFDMEPRRTGPPLREVHHAIEVSTTDSTNPGHAAYGVAHDPLSYPLSRSDLASVLQQAALAEIGEVIERQFSEYRNTFANAGMPMTRTDPEGAMDYLANFILLRPGDVPDDVAEWLDTAANLWDPGLLSR